MTEPQPSFNAEVRTCVQISCNMNNHFSLLQYTIVSAGFPAGQPFGFPLPLSGGVAVSA